MWMPYNMFPVLFGLLPALLFMSKRVQSSIGGLTACAALACGGIVLNRFVMTIQTLALPTLSFDAFMLYAPSWQELATFLAVIAYGVLVYSFSFRYLRLFPQERELALERQGEALRRLAV